MFIAQLNIASPIGDEEDSIMSEFYENLDRINKVAEGADGFVWRWIEELSGEIPHDIFDQKILINMSVWQSVPHLMNFTYRTDHSHYFKNRKKWFIPLKDHHLVIWYVNSNHRPDLKEAKHRMDYLVKNGESPYAFTFRSKFTAQDSIEYTQSEGLSSPFFLTE